jgi:hypothetical protein
VSARSREIDWAPKLEQPSLAQRLWGFLSGQESWVLPLWEGSWVIATLMVPRYFRELTMAAQLVGRRGFVMGQHLYSEPQWESRVDWRAVRSAPRLGEI